MEFAKKFTLVPEDGFSKHIPPPQQLSELDKHMLQILNNKQLNDDEKVKMYYNILQKKLNLEENNPPWVAPEPKPSVDYESLIVESTPLRMQKHTRNLLPILKSNPKLLKWNEHGELIIRDQILPHTNIIDLVNLLMGHSSKKVSGQDSFLSILKEMNLPQNYIKNKHLQSTKPAKNRILRKSTAKQLNPKWLKL